MADTPMGERTGRVAHVVRDKGFGFVKIPDEPFDAFFAQQDVADWPLCEKGTLLTYDLFRQVMAHGRTPYIARNCRIATQDVGTLASHSELEWGVASLCGRDHVVSEDDFLVKPLCTGRILLAVADGLSNPKNTGDWASSEVLYILNISVRNSCFVDPNSRALDSAQTTQNHMRALIDKVHGEFVSRKQQKTTDLRRALSTLTFVIAERGVYAWAGAGDTLLIDVDFSGHSNPCYIYGTAADRKRSHVRSAMGERPPDWHPRVGIGKCTDNHGLMICSDGVYLNDAQRFLTARLPLDGIALGIAENSLTKGNGDDVSIVLVKRRHFPVSEGARH